MTEHNGHPAPENSGLPSHYRHWQGDAAEDHMGPFFFAMESGVAHTAFRVAEHNCNGHRSVHGGVLMSFADYTICIASIAGGKDRVVTVTCNNEFIAPAFAGDLVTGRGEVVHRGGALIFLRCTLESEGRILLTSSGVVKRLRQVPPGPYVRE